MELEGIQNAMDGNSEQARLQKWLQDIASTNDAEIDCDALDHVLESVVAVGSRGEDIRAILPEVALHIEHCPECGEWYEALVALAREPA